MKVLILGASGLIGSNIFQALSNSSDLLVEGVSRKDLSNIIGFRALKNQVIQDVDDIFSKNLLTSDIDVCINCIGLTKHLEDAFTHHDFFRINTYFPKKLAFECLSSNIRLIHISSDCVFKGDKGNYSEFDCPDANDIYGFSKALGEINAYNSLTLRTSTIGHELFSTHGLLNWFLDQSNQCNGYKNAIFSGVTTDSLSQFILNKVLPNNSLRGILNIGSSTINKFELLNIIKDIYGLSVNIMPDESFKIDRSLDNSKMINLTKFQFPKWEDQILDMYNNKLKSDGHV